MRLMSLLITVFLSAAASVGCSGGRAGGSGGSSHSLGGSISGLSADGLRLRNGSDVLIVAAGSSSFTMGTPVEEQAFYSLTIDAQPAGQTCTVSNGTGQMLAANVSSVNINCVSVNLAPIAKAGRNLSVQTGALVRLDASRSFDANGDSLSYLWELRLRPVGSNAVLSATTTINPTFVADVDGDYMAVLVVNDGRLNSSNTGYTSIAAATARQNTAPIASAYASEVAAVGSLVVLDGSDSSDPNGDALTYSWTLVSKPNGSNASLSSSTAIKPTFTPDIAGDYWIQLRTNDGQVDSFNVSNVNLVAATQTSNITYAIETSGTNGDATIHPNSSYIQSFNISQPSRFLDAEFSFTNRQGTGALNLEIYRGSPEQPLDLVYNESINITNSTYTDTNPNRPVWQYSPGANWIIFNNPSNSAILPAGKYFLKLTNRGSGSFYIDFSSNFGGSGNMGFFNGSYDPPAYTDYPDYDISIYMRLITN